MIFGLWFGVPIAKHLGFFDVLVEISASADPSANAGTPTEDETAKPSPYQHLPPQIPRITTPQILRVFVTAYDPYDEICVGPYAHIWPRLTPGGSNPDITSGIAVDPAVIPYGSIVVIPEQGTFTVDDTGKDMRHAARDPDGAFYWMDIRIPALYDDFPGNRDAAQKEAHEIAKGHGAHWMDVEVIPPSNP